jgi:hypothetical protein
LYAAPRNVVVPAPLPPYALALFAPFALLNFPTAAAMWLALSVAATACAAIVLHRVLGIAGTTLALLFLLPATVLWLPFGEATPLALLGAAVAANGLQRGRPARIAAGLALLALEPHLALGAWISVLVFVPRARMAATSAGILLLAVCYAVNVHALGEYLGSVLPVHALAEAPRPAQYSLTWLLDALGTSPGAALRAGSVCYAVLLAGGIYAALRLRRRWNDPAVLIFAPLAASVVGGTFVHASHIVLALPLAALISVRERGRIATAGALLCAVLAVPWLQGGQQQTIVLIGVAVATTCVLMLAKDGAAAVAAFCGSMALALVLLALHRMPPPAAHARAFPAPPASHGLASASWGTYIWREQSAVAPADWAAKVPTWLALLLLAGYVVRLAADKQPVVAVRVYEAPAAP